MAQEMANYNALQFFYTPLGSLDSAFLASCFLCPFKMLNNVAMSEATTNIAFWLTCSQLPIPFLLASN